MKNILPIIFTLISLCALGSEIKTLNQGACWIQDKGDTFKASSFNEGSSYQISRDNLSEVIAFLATKKIMFEDINSFDSFVHCSGMGLKHVFKINVNSDVNYCLWSKFEKGKFKFEDFDLAEDYQGICDGVVSNRLIVAPSENLGLSEVTDFIESVGFKVLTKEVLYKDVQSISVSTNSNEIFKLQSLLKKSKVVRIVDLVVRNRPIGDSASTESLMYSVK